MTLREWADQRDGGVRVLRVRDGWPPEALVDQQGWFGPQWVKLYGVELGSIDRFEQSQRLAE